MLGQRFDYSGERQRHEKFVGRAELLARLDQLLVDGDGDRWVTVTGGPGMGKSAILAAWLARREGVGATVPHHFIRRGQYDWEDPAQLVGSLVAQLEERFAALRELEADARMHPAARLARMLQRVSEHELVPRLSPPLVDPSPPPRPGGQLAPINGSTHRPKVAPELTAAYVQVATAPRIRRAASLRRTVREVWNGANHEQP